MKMKVMKFSVGFKGIYKKVKGNFREGLRVSYRCFKSV